MTGKAKSQLAFCFGLGSITQTRVVGALALTELVCIFIAPFVLARLWPRMKRTRVRSMLIFMGLWLVSALLTDLMFRKTDVYDLLRGCAAIPFLGAMLVCAYGLLHDDLMRVRWLALGVALSSIMAIFVFQPQALYGRALTYNLELSEVINYKTYYVQVWSNCIRAVSALLYWRFPLLVVIAQLSVGVLNLFEGSRGAFLYTALAGIGSYSARFFYPTLRALQRNIVLTLLAASLIGWLAHAIYANAALSGWMGEAELSKYEMQSGSKIGLLAGRAEFIGALAAIKDSPIIGHGSWVRDWKGYKLRILEWLGAESELQSYYLVVRRKGTWYIPTHSHLWQAWVWHGFLGGLFWMACLVWMIKFLKHGVHLCRPLVAYNLMVTIGLIWALLFSPFTYRPAWGVLLTIIAVTLGEVDRRRNMLRGGLPCNINAPWDGKPDRQW